MFHNNININQKMEHSLLVKRKKKLAEEKLMEIEKEKNQTVLINLYINILNINNTDQNIVLKYLLFVKELYKDDTMSIHAKNDFNDYLYFLPVETWNNNFVDIIKKERSSLENIDLVFQKILSKNWVQANYKEMNIVIQFFRDIILANKKEIKNTSPITWENEELYIYFLFQVFIERIMNKIHYYSQESNFENTTNEEFLFYNNNIKYLESKKGTLKSQKAKDELEEMIKKQKQKRESIIICEGDFFKKYLFNFQKYLSSIQNSYLKDFSKKKFPEKEDKELFERFMIFVSGYEFENLPKYILEVWKNSFNNLDFSEKNNLFEIYNKQNLPFSSKFHNENKIEIIPNINQKSIIIDNIDDYDFRDLLLEIGYKDEFDEDEFIKYVKIPKINKHLYIKKIMKEWIDFNITIFNSKTIREIFDNLFDTQDDSLLSRDELKIIFDNIVFFNFDADFKGMTQRPTMKIYEYGPLIPLDNKDVSKLISLAFLLDINEHEILGHYNIGYQLYNTKDKSKYQSPIIDKHLASDYAKDKHCIESGENIEIKLYGRVIVNMTLKEALFILNPKNYEDGLVQFNKKFMKCNEEPIIIEKEFSDLLAKFNIDSKAIPKKNKTYSIEKFSKKYTDKNIYSIKGKHPIGYNIDGVKIKNLDFITDILDIGNLDMTEIEPIKELYSKLLENNS